MIANIFKDDERIDRIIADEGFAQLYCEQNGYTYELEPYPELGPALTPEPTDMERLRADVDFMAVMLGVEL